MINDKLQVPDDLPVVNIEGQLYRECPETEHYICDTLFKDDCHGDLVAHSRGLLPARTTTTSMQDEIGTFHARGAVLCFVTYDGIYVGPASKKTLDWLNGNGFVYRGIDIPLANPESKLLDPELQKRFENFMRKFNREESRKNLEGIAMDITNIAIQTPTGRYEVARLGPMMPYSYVDDTLGTVPSWKIDEIRLDDFVGCYNNSRGPGVLIVDGDSVKLAASTPQLIQRLEQMGFKENRKMWIPFPVFEYQFAKPEYQRQWEALLHKANRIRDRKKEPVEVR